MVQVVAPLRVEKAGMKGEEVEGYGEEGGEEGQLIVVVVCLLEAGEVVSGGGREGDSSVAHLVAMAAIRSR